MPTGSGHRSAEGRDDPAQRGRDDKGYPQPRTAPDHHRRDQRKARHARIERAEIGRPEDQRSDRLAGDLCE